MDKNLKIIIFLAVVLILGASFFGYSTHKAKKLGFSGYSQMSEIQKQGYETYSDYQNRYITGGFDSLEEMQEFNAIGIYKKSDLEKSGFNFEEYSTFYKYKYGQLNGVKTKDDFTLATGYEDIFKWVFVNNNDPYEMSNDELEKLDKNKLISLYESTLYSGISSTQFNDAIIKSFLCKDGEDQIEFFVFKSNFKDKHILTAESSGIFKKSMNESILFTTTTFDDPFIYDGDKLYLSSGVSENFPEYYWFRGVQPMNTEWTYQPKADYFISREGEGIARDLFKSSTIYFNGTCEKTSNQGERFKQIWLQFKKNMVNEAISWKPINQLL
jgi:hypothetical protein